MLDIVIGLTKEGVLSELLYADDLVLMSERIVGMSTQAVRKKTGYLLTKFICVGVAD